jgi:predicted PurR-regulated permease PerM
MIILRKQSRAILKIISTTLIVMILLKLCLIFLWPFIISILVVIIMEPFVKLFKKYGLSRKMAVILNVIILFFSSIFVFFYLSNYIIDQVKVIFYQLPNIIETLSTKFKMLNISEDVYKNLIISVEQSITSYKSSIIATLIYTVNGFIFLIVISMSIIFISLDLEKIVCNLKKYLPMEIYLIGGRIIDKITQIINVQMKLVVASILQTVTALYILGIDKPLTIGFICGILDVLPIVGPVIVFIPWSIYKFVSGDIFLGSGLLFLFLLLLISRKVLEIKLIHSNLRIQPVFIILSLYLGVIIYGIWGVICGPFLIILMKELFNFYFERRSTLQL